MLKPTPITVTKALTTAKSRKRCRGCGKMVEIGTEAMLTDDRWVSEAYKHRTGGYMTVQRGAWHL